MSPRLGDRRGRRHRGRREGRVEGEEEEDEGEQAAEDGEEDEEEEEEGAASRHCSCSRCARSAWKASGPARSTSIDSTISVPSHMGWFWASRSCRSRGQSSM